MGSMKSIEDIRGDRAGSCKSWAVRTVPYEFETTEKREMWRETRIRDMARQLACRSRGGDVMRLLMGSSSIMRMPTSGSWLTRSEKKER